MKMNKTLMAALISASFMAGSPAVLANTVDVAAAQGEAAAQTEAQRLITLTDAYLEETLPRAPLGAMFFGDNRFNNLWPNSLTDEFIAEGDEINQRYLKKLNKIKASELSGQDEYTYNIFRR